MNLSDSFAQSGFWVSICQVGWSCTRRFSREVICALQPCYSDVFNAFSSLGCWDFAWRMKILPSLIYLELRHMTSGEFPHQFRTTGILLWKNYADWLDENRPTYAYAIIFGTWRPIRDSRASLWWPHRRLSCNLVSYLLITRHRHQSRFNFGSLSMAGGNIRIV